MLLGNPSFKRRDLRSNKPTNENIYRLTLEIGFFFRIDYDDKRKMIKFPHKLRTELIHKFPEDVELNDNVAIARQSKRKIRLDIICGKMFLTNIVTGRQCFHRFEFNVKEGIINTSLLTLQYVDAQKMLVRYINTESTKLLSLICGTLFQMGYSRERANELAIQFEKVPFSIKEAIMLNFIAINNYLGRSLKYSILYDGTCSSEIKNTTSPGLADFFCLLSEYIYKDARIDENMGLIKFLDLHLKEIGK